MKEEEMPYSIDQLTQRRNNCMRKIQDLINEAEDKGGKQLYFAKNFTAMNFFSELLLKRSEEIDQFIEFFPNMAGIMDCILKAAKQEKLRRSYEQQLTNMKNNRRKKLKRLVDKEVQDQQKTIKHMRMLTDGSACGSAGDYGEGTSQQME